MSQINFVDILRRKQKEYIRKINENVIISRFSAFQDIFNYFQRGQTVAQIACGSISEDLFHTMERVGKEGRIVLIDEYPTFIYDRVLKILGEENLPKGKEFYTKTKEGKQILKKIFSQANIEVYVQRLPPYPEQIDDKSLDHVMAINAAFELMATNPKGEQPNIEGLIVETYRKLKNSGSLIVQGIMGEDIDLFGMNVHKISGKNRLRFEEDYELSESLNKFSMPTGYWGRWVKRE